MARRCLYYPFIHVRDEAWLKLSALYWDDMSRIVPRSYTPRDTRDVRALEEAGVLKRVDPASYEEPVSELFALLLERHSHKLAARYDVSRRDAWPENRERFGLRLSDARTSSSSLAFIHGSKLEPALTEQLLRRKLALPSRDRRWLGMHPAIVRAYMIALAAEIANRRGLQPVSDNVTHLSGVASCTVEDLAKSLFGDVNLSKKRPTRAANAKALDVAEERVAFVTLRAVLPQRLDAVPIKRILELRANHADARHAFHAYVEDVRKQLATGKIVDPEALDEHIRLEYDKRLKPALTELSRGLRSLGVGTFLGTFGVAVALPVGSMFSVSPSAAVALAGAGVGIAALSQRQQGSARALVKASPASFLLVTGQLRPRTLVERLTHGLRRFSLGV
ncbi:MAG TPA: DUF6236 family protein [Polyangiaceae bacterium]|nr:DUF6236 family protein [Polyangiaceae bacterium]